MGATESQPLEKAPAFCPMKNLPELMAEAFKEYQKPDVKEFARQASIQEAAGYANRELGYEKLRPIKSRMEEICEFAGRMGYRRLGLAFCVELAREAKTVEGILASKGFDVVSAIFKVGRIPKETIGVADEQKIAIGKFESMCNRSFR